MRVNETIKDLEDLSPQFHEYYVTCPRTSYLVNKVDVLMSRKIFSQYSTLQPTGSKLIIEY